MNNINMYKSGGRARVILIICESNWNAPAFSLVLLAFDITGSLVSPPRQVVWSVPLGSIVPPWVTASLFLAGKREAELKPTTFSSLLFCFFLSFIF